jgi:V/A-type H+-transporting ATPase subunit C
MIEPVKFSQNPEYGFANGRVRSLETALLDRSRYDRLMRCRDCAELVQSLGDTPYGRYLDGGARPFEAALAAAQADSLGFLAQYAFDRWLLEFFELPLRMRKLKSALKGRLAGGEPPADAESDLVAAAAAEYAQRHDASMVDIMLDRALHEQLLASAAPSGFLTGWLALHADVENLRTLLRVKVMGDDESLAARPWLAGGSIAGAELDALVPVAPGDIAARLRRADLQEYVEHGTGQLAARRSFAGLERAGRELELRFLRRSRYAVFGHEPLATYYLLLENEARNLRGVHAAKVAGLTEAAAQDLVAWVE